VSDRITRLARIVRDAATHVPFYRRHWAVAGHHVPQIRSREDFDALPLVTRRDLIDAAPGELLDRRYAQARLHVERTSGTSGQVFEMRYTASARRRRQLRFLHGLTSAGYRPGQALMFVSSQSAATIRSRRRWARWLRWAFVDMDDAPERIARAFEAHQPGVLYGPLSALLELGNQIGRRGINCAPRKIISTGERLTAGHRQRLEAQFHAPVTDFYGMTEFGLMALRPDPAGPYRLLDGDLDLEFLPSLCDERLERLVASDLRPAVQPIIRFDTGDLVRRDRTQPHQPVMEFVGREHDAIVLPGCRHLSPWRVTCALEAIDGIRSFRVLQQSDTSVDVHLDCRAGLALAQAQRSMIQLLEGLPLRLHAQDGPLPAQPGKQSAVVSFAGRPQS